MLNPPPWSTVTQPQIRGGGHTKVAMWVVGLWTGRPVIRLTWCATRSSPQDPTPHPTSKCVSFCPVGGGLYLSTRSINHRYNPVVDGCSLIFMLRGTSTMALGFLGSQFDVKHGDHVIVSPHSLYSCIRSRFL